MCCAWSSFCRHRATPHPVLRPTDMGYRCNYSAVQQRQAGYRECIGHGYAVGAVSVDEEGVFAALEHVFAINNRYRDPGSVLCGNKKAFDRVSRLVIAARNLLLF